MITFRLIVTMTTAFVLAIAAILGARHTTSCHHANQKLYISETRIGGYNFTPPVSVINVLASGTTLCNDLTEEPALVTVITPSLFKNKVLPLIYNNCVSDVKLCKSAIDPGQGKDVKIIDNNNIIKECIICGKAAVNLFYLVEYKPK